MAHLFADNTQWSYNATTAKYEEGSFDMGMMPFDYGNCATTYKQEVDLSVAGMVQDCAECHVGGGAMEYVPAPTIAGRTKLRDLTPAGIYVNGYWVNDGNYTAFNYFIDTYDVDGDGDKLEVLLMDWSKTGVMEMDCLLCHLKGYDYDARTAMLRDAKFDASRAVGSGVAAPNNIAFGIDGYGTEVYYNDLVVDVDPDDDGNDNATFNSAVLMNIKAAPPSENCGFCHFNMPGVDWKKRGDNWKQDVDAHWVLQCMGCHEGKVGSVIGTSGSVSSSDLGQCDPARGTPMYSSVWKNKKKTIKTCDDCHLRAGWDETLGEYSPDYGAPDPTGTHEYYGLTAKMCQTGTDGKINASHLDIIDCAACHVRKISDKVWNTGGAMVDATGPDHAGRLADHENEYVYRDMQENLCYTWQGTKIIPSSVLTTFFWRDKDDSELNGYDVNNDGLNRGMDTPLATHVLGIDMDNNATTMSMDNSGIIDSTVIAERITWLTDGLPAYLGNSDVFKIQLSSMEVPFKVTHNVSPASYALGHNCNDCHGAAAGIFNGPYALQGKHMKLSYDPTQVTCLTWVNAKSQKTDFHGNTKNKGATRSIACLPFSGGSDNLTAIDRSEILYEDNITTRNKVWTTYGNNIISDAITFVSPPKTMVGEALAIEASNTTTSANVTRIRKLETSPTSITTLLNELDAAGPPYFTTGFPEFTVSDGLSGNLNITPKTGYKIRISPSTSTAALGLTNAVWTAKGITSVNATHPGNPFLTRADWVDYLNGISASGCDCYPDAVASVCSGNFTAHGLHGHGIGCNCGNSSYPHFHGVVSSVTDIVYGVNATATSDYPHCVATSPWDIYEIEVCTPICFEADTLGVSCGGEYYWNFNDASGFKEGTQFSEVRQKVSHEFRDLGIFKVVLTVKNLYGNVDSHMILVNVVRGP